MKELLTRALSGIIYVGLILGCTFYNKYAFLALIGLLGVVCLSEFLNLITNKKGIYLAVAILLTPIIFYSFKFQLWRLLFVIPAIIINIMLFLGLKDAEVVKFLYDKKGTSITVLFYQVLGFISLAFIPFLQGNYQPFLILGLFILVWVNDSFAYLSGSAFGKHKLCPSISPNKSIEGFVGGFIMTLVVSFLLYKYVGILSWQLWLAYGTIASVIGSIGDLVQSKFKRKAGVKDSGSIMPGHGGIFDRLDSVLYASPFVFLLLNL